MKIGVISDTHGYLHSGVFRMFDDVDIILHAGDVGNLQVLEELRLIALRVVAVWGNMDGFDVRRETKEKRVLEKNGVRIGLCHGGGSPYDIKERLAEKFSDDNVNIIVFGHTHLTCQEQLGDIFFFNPGDGRKTLGIITIREDRSFNTEIKQL